MGGTGIRQKRICDVVVDINNAESVEIFSFNYIHDRILYPGTDYGLPPQMQILRLSKLCKMNVLCYWYRHGVRMMTL